MKTLNEVAAKYVCDLVANPDHIMTVNSNHLVIYDLRKHEVVKHEPLANLDFEVKK